MRALLRSKKSGKRMWPRLALTLVALAAASSLASCSLKEQVTDLLGGLFKRATSVPTVAPERPSPTPSPTLSSTPELLPTGEEVSPTSTGPTFTPTVTVTPSPTLTATPTIALITGPAATLIAMQTLSYTPPPYAVDATPMSGEPIGTLATRSPGRPAATWTPGLVIPLNTPTPVATSAPTNTTTVTATSTLVPTSTP